MVTNLSVYYFPPLMCVGELQFLVCNEYTRVPLSQLLLACLPRRTDRDKGVALRTDVLTLHSRDGSVLWLETRERSLVAEVVCQACEAMLGCPLDVSQPDYAVLSSLVATVRRRLFCTCQV